jgi:D-alanyl-D-alanine carboxypeptidase/D-alanyl-D-alanine-endopeptidase (penicillin-binding protein 4)
VPLFATPTLDAARLDAILNSPKFSGAIMSAAVTDSDGNVLYTHEDGRHVVPASNQKLLTTAFALSTLGPDYRPTTKFWKLPDGLHIETDGDPMLTHEELAAERKKLGDYNSRKVWVKEAYSPGIPPSWEWDDLPNKYAAPVTALTVDRNSFELWSIKGRAVLKPFDYGVKIAIHPGAEPWSSKYDPSTRQVDVFGKLPTKDTRLDTLALPKADEAAASLLGHRFEVEAASPTSQPDDVLLGHTTIETIDSCLPPSDNNLAEGLLMLTTERLSVKKEDPYEAGSREMTRFLTTVVGIDPRDLHITDGSGMSRQNFVTTRGVAKLLCWAGKQPTAAAWKAALSTPDKGTVKGRVKGIDFRGKTGSLNMVSSLSGYLHTKSGKDLIVSLIFNEFTVPNSEAHQVQDAFIRALDESTP